MTDQQASTPYTELLRQLPEYQPPGHLWTSILEARLVQQQRTLRRRSALAGSALAACLVLAVVIAWQPAPVPLPAQSSAQQVEALVRTAERLEQSLQEQASRFAEMAATRQHLILAQQAQLVALDQVLANAYQRQEPADRLAQLWQRRVDLMTGLVDLYQPQAGEKT